MRTILVFLLAGLPALAAGPDSIPLPKPNTDGGKPLMRALLERRSAREFSSEKLPAQVLSNLLWAAYGVNRSDGHRTAPSAMNKQTIDVYAVTPDGAYMYNAKSHRLDLVAPADLRSATGTQAFAGEAPLDLVYVADYSKMSGWSEEDRLLFSGAETGFIGENVYLYCASDGLAAVIRASINRDALAQALKLRSDQKITLAQTVGYPKSGK
jgi:SagB-type dehydrogenase family enzyme